MKTKKIILFALMLLVFACFSVFSYAAELRATYICPYCHSSAVSKIYGGTTSTTYPTGEKCPVSICKGFLNKCDYYSVDHFTCNNSTCLARWSTSTYTSTRKVCDKNNTHIF